MSLLSEFFIVSQPTVENIEKIPLTALRTIRYCLFFPSSVGVVFLFFFKFFPARYAAVGA
jgi:hypothetical protein